MLAKIKTAPKTLRVWCLLQDNGRYLYVLRGTPSTRQCFQLYPARWFQPYCPSIPSASSCCLLKPTHFSSKQTHCEHQVHRESPTSFGCLVDWIVNGLRLLRHCNRWHSPFSDLKETTAGQKGSQSIQPTHHSYLEWDPSVLCTSLSTSYRHSEQRQERLFFVLFHEKNWAETKKKLKKPSCNIWREPVK